MVKCILVAWDFNIMDMCIFLGNRNYLNALHFIAFTSMRAIGTITFTRDVSDHVLHVSDHVYT